MNEASLGTRTKRLVATPAQEVAASAQAFVRSALALAAILQFSGAPALEWARALSE